MMTRADSAPARWPSIRGKWRCLAQRPFPSMIMATWRGKVAFASGLRWAVWVTLLAAKVQIVPGRSTLRSQQPSSLSWKYRKKQIGQDSLKLDKVRDMNKSALTAVLLAAILISALASIGFCY